MTRARVPRPPVRRAGGARGWIAFALVLCGLLTGGRQAHAGGVTFLALADVSAERVQIANLVAAAKFGTPAPIDDPAREQVVLDTAARRAAELGVDPALAVRVFRDQIEASKLVQRALHARWTAHPDEAPAERPDLETEVRPRLDRITEQILRHLRDTEPLRASPTCLRALVVGYRVVESARRLDHLQELALGRALLSICV
ncbi:chorismate mutase [Actinokineospora iranica]|uniref:chorismate mutase n=1 Tax=Actinokineospora iranica TaxID=1271860 RepID=A0A1G6N5P1_9PSEU|nr:chorismate mutase [Actinokineospora iranica]